MAESLRQDLLPSGFSIEGRYRILRPMGRGGMGTVYEAEHMKLEKRVAIKCLHPDLASRELSVKRFHREALAATKIGHENIIDVTDLGRLDDGTVFMVMEYLDGCDFGDLINYEGVQPVARVAHVLTQVCEALEAAHGKGIVHRDLKPDNIFITTRHKDPFFVKVFDFGISKFLDEAQIVSGKLTRTGTIIGTPWYMSPEQIDGDSDLDHRTDIYALGVILFCALTGRHPFEEESFTRLVVAISNREPPNLRELRDDVPEPISVLCDKMLSKSRDERPDSCREIIEALAPYLTGDRGDEPSFPSFGSEGTFSTGLAETSIPESGVVAMPGRQAAEGLGLEETAEGDFGALVPSKSNGGASRSGRTLLAPLVGVVLVAGIGWSWLQGSGGGGDISVREEPVGAEAALAPSTSSPPLEPASVGSPETAVVPERAPVRLESDPAGATIWSGEDALGVTPLPVPRPEEGAEPLRLRLELSGHESAVVILDRVVQSPHRVTLRPQAVERTPARPGSRSRFRRVSTPLGAPTEMGSAMQPSRSRPAPANRPTAPASMRGRFLDPWAGSM